MRGQVRPKANARIICPFECLATNRQLNGRQAGYETCFLPGMTPEQDCGRIHEVLLSLLGLLDAEFRAPDQRAVRTRLVERATVGCANARLGRLDDLRVDLRTLLADAEAMPERDTGDVAVARLKRLITSGLSGTAQPDV